MRACNIICCILYLKPMRCAACYWLVYMDAARTSGSLILVTRASSTVWSAGTVQHVVCIEQQQYWLLLPRGNVHTCIAMCTEADLSCFV
jgi:hypothetical protein